MTESSERNGPLPAPREIGEDTIELELTEEEERRLAAAAAQAEGAAVAQPADDPIRASAERYVNRRTARIDFICTVIFSLVLAGIAAAAMWPDSDRRPAVAAHPASLPAAPVTAAPAPAPAPVRIENPFDKTEVFEFPPDTPAGDAREAVAQWLLERARERAAHRAGPAEPREQVAAASPDRVIVTPLTAPAPGP
jgi:hypothetical protein